MSKPLTNDFGLNIPKHKAREVLIAHGWVLDHNSMWFKPLEPHNPVLTKQPFGLTLREAYENHKFSMAVMTVSDMTKMVHLFGKDVQNFGAKVDAGISAMTLGFGSTPQGARSP